MRRRADEDRLACEMAVDLRTVRRWLDGSLVPSRSSVLAMRALYALRLTAPDSAAHVWLDTDEAWQARLS